MGVQVRRKRFPLGLQIQFFDRAIWKIAGVVHNDIHLAHISGLGRKRTPLLFLGHVKFKRVPLQLIRNTENLEVEFVWLLAVNSNRGYCRRPYACR